MRVGRMVANLVLLACVIAWGPERIPGIVMPHENRPILTSTSRTHAVPLVAMGGSNVHDTFRF